MNDRKARGLQAEQWVVHHLEKQGYHVKARNLTCAYGEIDIIAQKNDLLVCVEVKMRANPLFDMTELISFSKQRKIIMTAKHFLSVHLLTNVTVRFDVALVTTQDAITYLENAFTEQRTS